MSPRQVAIAGGVLPGLIVISVAAALGNLTWDALRPRKEPHSIVTRPRTLAGATTDIAPILALAPFGTADVVSTDSSNAPLVLRGILLAEPAALSTAMIGTADGGDRAYHVGERLPNGAVLTGITRQEATLQEAGTAVRLGFPHRGKGGSDGEPASPEEPPGPSSEREPRPAPPTDAKAGVAAMRALLPNSVLHPGAPTGSAPAAPLPPPR